MNALHFIFFLIEIWGLMFLVWGAFHQDRIIHFERAVASAIRKAVRGK